MNPLLDAIGSLLSGAGYVLDTPGALLRGALAGSPGERRSGREMLEDWGVLSENQEGLDAGDALGFGADLLFDPLNLIGGGLLKRGLGMADDAADATKAIGAIDDVPAPRQLVRFEEPGISRATFDKPHGIYTTPGEFASPHSDLGGVGYKWNRSDDANVLDVSDMINASMRRGTTSFGAGVGAAKKLLGDEWFTALRNAPRSSVMEEASRMFPDVDFSRYYDAQEIMEAIGGLEARRRGYDAIEQLDNLPEFTEYVGLTERSMTPAGLQLRPEMVNKLDDLAKAKVDPQFGGGRLQINDDPVFKDLYMRSQDWTTFDDATKRRLRIPDAMVVAKIEAQKQGEGAYRALHNELAKHGRPIVVESVGNQPFMEKLRHMGYQELDGGYGTGLGHSYVYPPMNNPAERTASSVNPLLAAIVAQNATQAISGY